MADTFLRLREDIELSSTGEKQWTLYDKGSTKYYRLHELPFLILSYYGQSATPEELLQNVQKHHPCTIEDIEEVMKFCKDNFLFQSTSEDVQRLIVANQKMKNVPWYTKLVHGYLFFKIHIINPDQLLSHTQRYVNFFFSKQFLFTMIVFFLVNLVFLIERFSEFISTLTNFETMEGVLYLAGSIAFVKFFHELGHAYTAKRLGCNVPSMGVAFMVFYPMPYTDTSDGWRLNKNKRMQIALAGVKTEIVIASLAMTAWLILPDGALKSMMFFIVGVSFISTLAVNLTPFMRFDGYYALSDYLGIENLHQRSFSQAKAFVKKYLWGIDIPVEIFSKRMTRFLILFAFTTWIYRFFLFAGIAYLVYSHTFKVLGIILFWIEVWYFIAMPIVKEVKEWLQLRSKMKLRIYNLIGWGVVLTVGSLIFIPYSTSIYLPAVADANRTALLYAEYDSQVIYVHPEGEVKKGDLILSAQSITNDLERQSAMRKLQLFQAHSARAFVSDETLADTARINQSLKAEQIKIQAAESLKSNMNLYAPIDGILSYEEHITTGQFIGSAQKIARITDPSSFILSAYAPDTELFDIKESSHGKWFDHLTLQSYEVYVYEIASAPEESLNEPLLDSNYKGPITVGHGNVPQRPQYKIHLRGENCQTLPLEYKRFGEVKIEIQYQSFFERSINTLQSIFIRESSF